MDQRFISTSEAASRLSVSAITIRRWTDDGILQCRKTAGGHRRYLLSDIEALQAEKHGAAAPSNAPDNPHERETHYAPPTFDSRFYHDVNMASTVLKLNLSIASMVHTMQGEVDRVSLALDSVESLSPEKNQFTDAQASNVNNHVNKLITALQYEDALTQKIGAVQSALDGINETFKLYLSQFDPEEKDRFMKEITNGNKGLSQGDIHNFINNVIAEGKPKFTFSAPTENIDKPELF